jgi:hypothetical protein
VTRYKGRQSAKAGAIEEAKSESDNGGFSYRNRNSAMTKWLS